MPFHGIKMAKMASKMAYMAFKMASFAVFHCFQYYHLPRPTLGLQLP